MKQLIFITFLMLFLFSCKKDNPSTFSTNIFHEKAKQLLKTNSRSAYYYFNVSKNTFLENKDSLGAARALANMAVIQTNIGDYYGSIETSLESNKLIKRQNKDDTLVKSVLASNYNNLAIAFSNLKNYDSSVSYYHKALKVVTDEENRLIYYNNIGDVLIRQKKLPEAKEYLKKAMAAKIDSNYARALNNLAKAKFLENKNYDPLPELFKALEIRKRIKNSLGENSSYATLADYYFNRDKSKSLAYAKMMLDKALKNKSPDDQLEALDKIIQLDPANYLQNFSKFQFINDSIQTARNQAKNQFAFYRYDLEGKRAETEKLKARNTQQYFILVLLSLTIIIIVIWYRRRQIRLQQEKELEIKNTQLKLSKKVHDVVANGIYQVMTKIETQNLINKDEMLDELEFVYEKSRDISYEKTDKGNKKDFNEKISELVGSFNNENVKTYLAGNDKDIWAGLNEPGQEEIYQIIRELLVNMRKHSQADRVVFRFERANGLIKIYYSDNGIGISSDIAHKNGLTNAVSRIESLNGEIIFDTKTEKGLKIYVSFPVS